MGSSSPPPPPDHPLRTLDSSSHFHRRLIVLISLRSIAFCFLLIITCTAFSHSPFPLDRSSDPFSCFLTVFLYFNAFSFFSSLSGLIMSASSAFSALIPPNPDGFKPVEMEIDALRKLLAAALPKLVYADMFLVLSLTCCAVAFPFAGLATVRGYKAGQLAIIIPSAIGGFVFLQGLLLLFREMSRFWWGIFLSDLQLWEAVKEETIFGNALTRYMEIVCGDLATGRAAREQQGSVGEREGTSQDDDVV